MIKRPMGAMHLKKFDKLVFPILGSPKRDGFRCAIVNSEAKSKSLKPIANEFTRNELSSESYNNLDGELMLRDPATPFNEISSAFRAYKGEPDFLFYVFDYIDTELGFSQRLEKLQIVVSHLNQIQGLPCRVVLVDQVVLNNLDELYAYEKKCLKEGFEGVMIRSLDGPYKQGKSTEKEGYLLKLKRTKDSEAEILGFVELMHNENPKETNELGLTKRATKKENLIPAGTLGVFKLRDLYSLVEFECGTGKGLTAKLRQEIWNNRDKYLGQVIKYEYQPVGVKEKPRHPIWLAFRGREDLEKEYAGTP